MTDHPMIFSPEMVRALGDGRKAQTRRVLKPQPPDWCADDKDPGRSIFTPPGHIEFRGKLDGRHAAKFIKQPYAPGDRIWVKEACALVGAVDPPWVLYRADGYEAECARHGFDRPYPPEPRWRSPIFMPKRFSRFTLVVTRVRIQRVQDISGEDCTAEGVPFEADALAPYEWSVSRFRDIWDRLHGPGAWDRNDWIAALTFDVHKRNILEMDG